MGFISDHWADEARLSELLRARPDLDSPPLRSLADLDYRSRSDPWYSNGMMLLDVIGWGLIQASCLCEPDATLQQLTEMMGDEVTIDEVTEAAHTLQRLGMAIVDNTAMLLDPNIRRGIDAPGGLGPWAAALMEQHNVDSLRKIVERLGGTVRSPRKADVVAQVLALIDDAPTVYRAIDALPPHAVSLLQRLAMGSAYISEPAWYTPGYPPTSAIEHLAAIGILLPAHRHQYVLIREVSLLLRGGRHIVLPKQPTSRRASDLDDDEIARLTQRSCLAAATMLSDLTRLCAMIDRTPLQVLQSGGVGSSQIKKVGKELTLEPTRVADLIDAAAMAGIIDITQPVANGRRRQAPLPATVVLSDLHARWQSKTMAEQWCYLVESWYHGMLAVGFSMRPDPDKDNKIEPAMRGGIDRYAMSARHRLADLLRSGAIAPALERGAWFAWQQPWINRSGLDFDAGITAEVDFLELLGVCCDGYVHEAGRAALTDLSMPGNGADTNAAVIESVEAWLGTNTAVLTVQGDMTMIITGHAPAELTSELMLMADIVSHGHATVYRISESSLHRAFEYGRTAVGLVDLLTTYGSTALPNAVATLFGDAERRFGRFRVSSPASVIVVADALAAAELASSRNAKVKVLRLTRLAETVFASPEPLNQVLVALKEAGMAATSALPGAPPPGPGEPSTTATKAGARRSTRATAGASPATSFHYRRPRPTAVARPAAEVARQLLAAPPPPPAPQSALARQNDLLEILRASLDTGEPLNILYVERSGKAKAIYGVVEHVHGNVVQLSDEYNRTKLIPLHLIVATSFDEDDFYDEAAGDVELDFGDDNW